MTFIVFLPNKAMISRRKKDNFFYLKYMSHVVKSASLAVASLRKTIVFQGLIIIIFIYAPSVLGITITLQ